MQLLSTAAACIVLILIAAGCSGQVETAPQGSLPAEEGTLVMLVENTSISLRVKPLEPVKDPLSELVRSVLNILEGKGR